MVDHLAGDPFQGLTDGLGMLGERVERFAHRAVELFGGHSDCLVDRHAQRRPPSFRNHAAALPAIAGLPDRTVRVHARQNLGEVGHRCRFVYETPPAQRRGARLDVVVVLGGENNDG